MQKHSNRWIDIAAVYFLVAVVLGLAMSAAHDYTLKGVHVHLNLLGWVSVALFVFNLFVSKNQAISLN
jgi:membrane protein YdbS with pleckstrin-like domain